MNLGKLVAQGNTAQIYLKDQVVVKLFNEWISESYRNYEAEKQINLFTQGIRVPEIYELTKINGKQAIIMEYIEGPTLGVLYQQSTCSMNDLIEMSIDVQLSLHNTKVDSIESMPEKLSRQIKDAPHLQDKEKDILIKQLHKMKYEQRLCHGDFHLFNIIQSKDGQVVIDWVDATSGDPRADVYRTYLLYLQHSESMADLYLQQYCQKSELEREEIMQWAPIIAGARLSENVSTEKNERLLKIVHQYI